MGIREQVCGVTFLFGLTLACMPLMFGQSHSNEVMHVFGCLMLAASLGMFAMVVTDLEPHSTTYQPDSPPSEGVYTVPEVQIYQDLPLSPSTDELIAGCKASEELFAKLRTLDYEEQEQRALFADIEYTRLQHIADELANRMTDLSARTEALEKEAAEEKADMDVISKCRPYIRELITEAVLLGTQAIDDQLKTWGNVPGLIIRERDIKQESNNEGQFVSVILTVELTHSHRVRIIQWKVCYKPIPPFPLWTQNEAMTRSCQMALPPEIRGLRQNANKFITDTIYDDVRRATGYEGLAYGDLWVHSCDTLEEAQAQKHNKGMVAFGYITRAGEIALEKLERITQKCMGPEQMVKYHEKKTLAKEES